MHIKFVLLTVFLVIALAFAQNPVKIPADCAHVKIFKNYFYVSD